MSIFDILKGDTSSLPTHSDGDGLMAIGERKAREQYRKMSDIQLLELRTEVYNGRIRMDDRARRILFEEMDKRGL